jgi:hypothetical protein
MKEPNLELAKKRIWKRLSMKLPDRGIPSHVFAVSKLRESQELVKSSTLKRVQFKEHLLDILPDRVPAFSFLPRKVWALGSLSLLMGALFVPVMEMSPVVSASTENTLDIVAGDVYVNGVLVSGIVTVQEGDRIETGEGSMAHIYLVDDSRVTLGPSTQVDLVTSIVDPSNRAKTEVHIQENKGRVWSQVLNLVSNESSFVLSFPEGQVSVTQKASFDVLVSEATTEIEVARNLVSVTVNEGDLSYQGVLGQGASLNVGSSVTTTTISSDEQKEVWWTFNLAYGKSYTRGLDASYKQENIDRAVILPGNPFYVLKTFRENLQVSLAMTSDARQNLLVEQAQNRLNEAQTLLARGDTAEAAQVLEVYQQTVAQVSDTDNEALLAQVDETQKQVLVSDNADNSQLLQDHLSNASATVSSDLSDKSEAKMNSVSQMLQQVPDLIDAGSFDSALQVLSDYQSSSLSILSELQDVPMDQRETVVSGLLVQKLSDIQLLRVIAAMPQLKGALDADSTIMEQMSVMVLSLREKELGDLSTFFTAHDYNAQVQQEMYDRLKDGADMTPELTQQLDTVEQQMQPVQPSDVLIDIQPVEEDPRFSVSHTDEPQDQADSGQ